MIYDTYDLTTDGIPQQDVNPLVQELNRPWEESQAAIAESKAKWRAKSLENVDHAVTNWDEFSKGKNINLSFDPNPENAKKRGIVATYLTIANDNQPIPGGELGPQMMRDRLARERFQGRGVGSDSAFYDEVAKESNDRIQAKDLYAGMATAAVTAATVQDMGEKPLTFQNWREDAQKHPGYKPENDADYHEAWIRSQQAVTDRIAPFRDELSQVWQGWKETAGAGKVTGVAVGLIKDAFLGGEGNTDDSIAKTSTRKTAWDIYSKLKPDERDSFMDALGILAKNIPKEEQPAFFANIAKQSGRDLEGLAQGAGTATTNFLMDPAMWDTSAGAEGPTDYRRQSDFVQKIQNLREGTYDPVKKVTDGYWGKLGETVAYGTSGVVATSLAASNPFTAPALFASLTENHYQSLLKDKMDLGESYEKASAFATAYAPLGAVVETGSEMLGSQLLRGKLPFLDKALTGVMNRLSNPLLRAGTRFAVGGAESGLQEIGQNYIDPLLEAYFSETGKAVMPGAQENVEAFASVFPLAMIGIHGAFREDQQAKAFGDASPLQLRALGIQEENIAAISAAKLEGVSSLVIAADEAMAARVPETEQARAAVEQLNAELVTSKQAQEALYASHLIPRTVRSPDGTWAVYDQDTGAELGAGISGAEAFRVATNHSSALNESQAENVASDAQAVMRRDVLATSIEATDTMQKQLGAADSTVDLSLGEAMDTQKMMAISPQNEARMMQQMILEDQAAGGDGSAIRSVLGQNITELHEDVRQTINRIYAGGSVMTIFHEKGHEMRGKAYANGAMDRNAEVRMYRAIDTILAGKTVGKDGRPLQLIKDGVADADITETNLDEAFSSIMESEVIRSGRDSRSGIKVPRGILSRNVMALAKLQSPRAMTSFNSLVKAVRHYWGIAFSRARHLTTALNSGELNAAGYHDFVSKMLGLNDQDAHNKAAVAARNEILATKNEVEFHGDSFSLGRSTVTPTTETKHFQGAEGSPSVIGPAAFSIAAYHGTPHKVDKFSTDKIGTGEGAQAYGYGLYFAESKTVADGYRKTLLKSGIDGAQRMLARASGDINAAIATATAKVQKYRDGGAESYAAAVEEDLRFLEQFRQRGKWSSGNLYTVTLDVNDEDLLDWDKPLCEQSERVKASILKQMPEKSWEIMKEKSGQDYYEHYWNARPAAMAGDIRTASNSISALGILGIRYLDGNSRSDGEGSSNYVIFDESKIKITEENGKPVKLDEASFSLGPAQVAHQVDTKALTGTAFNAAALSELKASLAGVTVSVTTNVAGENSSAEYQTTGKELVAKLRTQKSAYEMLLDCLGKKITT
jgi:hypothetical protein